MLIQNLYEKDLIKPPPWLPNNVTYLTVMGSMAYGVSEDSSDFDVYGFCIPPKTIVFPHLAGKIIGFDSDLNQFNEWQQHHIFDPDALRGKGRQYDFSIFSIVKYFALLADNNPNIVDSIFTPANCVLHTTTVGNMVRENRKMFLHKGSWHRFKGYAYSQLNKTNNKKENPLILEVWNSEAAWNIDPGTTYKDVQAEMAQRGSVPGLSHLEPDQLKTYAAEYEAMMAGSKRHEKVKIEGTDRKFLYHVVRLLDEVEQIMLHGDIDLQRNKEQLKAVRRGDMTEEQVREYFAFKEKELESLYLSSKIPHSPDRDKLRGLLMNCLEEHYGSLANCVAPPVDKYHAALLKMSGILQEVGL